MKLQKKGNRSKNPMDFQEKNLIIKTNNKCKNKDNDNNFSQRHNAF